MLDKILYVVGKSDMPLWLLKTIGVICIIPTIYYHQGFTLYKKDILKIIVVICIITPIQKRYHLEDRDVDGRIVPTFILKKQCDVRIGLIWLKMGAASSCDTGNTPARSTAKQSSLSKKFH